MYGIKRYLPIYVLVVLSLGIIAINRVSGTWLTGWDNLHPEFNFTLNIHRSLFAVWQEYQGLGLLGGMGHAADLPRQLFLLFLSPFIQTNDLRYVFTSLMLIIGPIGVYTLLKKLVPSTISYEICEIVSFLGGLFYLLNLATVQVFYVPFEAFITQYGFLPWLIYFVVSYLKEKKKRTLFLFFILSFISTTQSYVPTLFVVYMVALVSVMGGYVLHTRSKEAVKRSIVLFVVTLVANAFWLLPFAYFTLTSASVVGNAHQNFMATDDIYQRNTEFGTITDTVLLKGFWFKFVDMDPERNFFYMTKTWNDYSANPLIQMLGFGLFIVVIIGLFIQFRRKHPFSYALFFLFIIPFTLLSNATPPFSWISDLLHATVPLFAQVFRVPFTKFAVLAAFSYSLLFAFGSIILISYAQKIKSIGKYIVCFVLSISLVAVVFPAFLGEFFYKYEQLSMPEEYRQTMQFFRMQDPNTRIATFPQPSYWGWNHFSWGYRGSGFLWYGIEQPILDRAFDGYSSYSENYYWEVYTALGKGDVKQFKDILEKYQIQWIVVDQNIISATSVEGNQLARLDSIVNQLSSVALVKTYKNIKIYSVALSSKPTKHVIVADGLPSVGPTVLWGNNDRGFADYGIYTGETGQKAQTKIYYPFRTLFTGRTSLSSSTIESTDSEYIFTATLPKEESGGALMIPVGSEKNLSTIFSGLQLFIDNELVDVSNASIRNGTISIPIPYINQGKMTVHVPRGLSFIRYDSNTTDELFNQKSRSCNIFNTNEYSHKIIEEGSRAVRLISVASSNCRDIYLSGYPNDQGYLVGVNHRYIQGKPLLFWILNSTTGQSDADTYLVPSKNFAWEYFVVPPSILSGYNYQIHLDNIAIGPEKTINDIARVTVDPIPYELLTGIRVEKKTASQTSNNTNLNNLIVDKMNESQYMIQGNVHGLSAPVVILSQGFDAGWQLYEVDRKNFLSRIFPPIFGENVGDHILVNNWENGWKIDQTVCTSKGGDCTFMVLYLPQYLEYVGFLVFFLSGSFLFYLWRRS